MGRLLYTIARRSRTYPRWINTVPEGLRAVRYIENEVDQRLVIYDAGGVPWVILEPGAEVDPSEWYDGFIERLIHIFDIDEVENEAF